MPSNYSLEVVRVPNWLVRIEEPDTGSSFLCNGSILVIFNVLVSTISSI